MHHAQDLPSPYLAAFKTDLVCVLGFAGIGGGGGADSEEDFLLTTVTLIGCPSNCLLLNTSTDL